ncbi:hypothetical protein PMIN01_11348 [Paraphaeosphaeria minitans]|uniref:Uncharacterized protein n=1 Tax=Paraphaeosphaeria minitans TaxID=565426 RepID=A0A9P6KLG9_9PLEO|nr:hypothetical protein PMIN01_11348 [Paraphaeosphaeria minitans]
MMVRTALLRPPVDYCVAMVPGPSYSKCSCSEAEFQHHRVDVATFYPATYRLPHRPKRGFETSLPPCVCFPIARQRCRVPPWSCSCHGSYPGMRWQLVDPSYSAVDARVMARGKLPGPAPSDQTTGLSASTTCATWLLELIANKSVIAAEPRVDDCGQCSDAGLMHAFRCVLARLLWRWRSASSYHHHESETSKASAHRASSGREREDLLSACTLVPVSICAFRLCRAPSVFGATRMLCFVVCS